MWRLLCRSESRGGNGAADVNGSVVADAAILPAGTGGAVSIYVTDATDVVFDIKRYFAP